MHTGKGDGEIAYRVATQPRRINKTVTNKKESIDTIAATFGAMYLE